MVHLFLIFETVVVAAEELGVTTTETGDVESAAKWCGVVGLCSGSCTSSDANDPLLDLCFTNSWKGEAGRAEDVGSYPPPSVQTSGDEMGVILLFFIILSLIFFLDLFELGE